MADQKNGEKPKNCRIKVTKNGPYLVQGNIPIESAEGKMCEVRNRVTLCRCGKSQNKPFCDSSHYPE